MWLSDARVRNRGTRFLQPSPLATMTIPATAGRVISVGAYDARRAAVRGIFRARMAGTEAVRPAGSGGSGSGSHDRGSGRRLRFCHRDFLCRSFCGRGGGASHGMGDYRRKRSLPLRREGEGLSSERGQAASRLFVVAQQRAGIRRPVRPGQSAGVMESLFIFCQEEAKWDCFFLENVYNQSTAVRIVGRTQF